MFDQTNSSPNLDDNPEDIMCRLVGPSTLTDSQVGNVQCRCLVDSHRLYLEPISHVPLQSVDSQLQVTEADEHQVQVSGIH